MKKILQSLFICIATSATAQTPLFINELHYDNDGADLNEFVEIAGPANTDLDAAVFTLEMYSVTALSNTVPLSGKLSDNGCGFGFYSINVTGIQNGPTDAIALVKDGTVLHFISYEGTVTAADGSAMGLTSKDIGVAEDGTTGTGTLSTESLQLTGTGTEYEDFTWASPAANTKDAVNNGQVINAIPSSEISFASAAISELESAGTITVTLSLDKAASADGTVTVSIADNTATTVTDYSATVGVLNVTKGETSISFDVMLTEDTEVENDETFTATIDATSCLLSIGATNSVVFTITDNDVIPVSVNENAKNKIQIYPNPSNGVVNIQNSNNEKVEFFNVLGELILSTYENKINLDKGIYIVKVGAYSRRVIIE